jgi:DedD protein
MPQAAVEPAVDELRRRARRRLVGAVILALAAAVVVPMLLESDPKPLGEDVSVKIPPVDEGKFVNRLNAPGASDVKAREGKPADPKPSSIVPVPAARPVAPTAPASADASAPRSPAVEVPSKDTAAAKRSLAEAEQRVLAPANKAVAPAGRIEPATAPKGAAPSPASSTVTTEETPASEAKPVATDVGPAETTAAPSEAKPKVAAVADAGKSGAFAVQLAAFADDKGANALAAKLKRSGYPAYTEPVSTSRGTLWRVRVGPYTTRETADAARDKLKGEGQSGIVTAGR